MGIDTSTRSSKVREHLLDFIRDNNLDKGEQLPSEAEMAAKIGVSRNTIREAYIALESEGVISRKHGIGTFVLRPPKIKEQLLDDLIGFPHAIETAGYSFDFKIISVARVTSTSEVAHALQCDPGQQVLQVKYLLYADGIPSVYDIDCFSPEVDASLFNWDEFDGRMLDFVSISLGIPERRIRTRFRAVLADAEIADTLSLSPGTPIVNVHSTITTMDGRPITYSSIFLNPESIEFEVARVYRHR